MHTRGTGNLGEDVAVNFLADLGWKIVGRNLHYRFGEIDVLADSGEHMVIIEVKVKKSLSQGYAVEMVTPSKQRTLQKLAQWVAVEYNKPVRIDVITIDNFKSHQPVLTHYPFAVGES